MARRWSFIENTGRQPPRWVWRQLADNGGSDQKSREFDSYGEAIRDAIIHGFRPTEDHWAIESARLVTHYANGQQTIVTPRRAKTVAQGKRPSQRRE
jgi:hypothetical protein